VIASGSGITDVGLDYLGQAFRKRAPLQNMGFDFFACKKITNTGLKYLAQSFSKHISFKHIHLCFDA